MEATPRTAVQQDTRYAWIMVSVCAGMVAMAFGAMVNMAVFLTPLAAEFGWPRGDLALAYSIMTVGAGLGGVVMGYFSDRIPVRRVALCGAVVTGGSFLLLAGLESTWELYLYHALMGVVGLGAVVAPMNSLASLWLHRNPGLAIGVVSAGGALGQALLPFFAQELVLINGWRHSYMVLGLVYLGVMVPLAMLVRNAPASAQAAGSGAGSGTANPYAVSRPTLLVLLAVAVLFCCVCMSTPIVHVAALGSDLGLGGREAAALLTVMMIAAMAGRIAFGAIADRFGNLQAYIVASLGQTTLAFLFPYAGAGAELYVLSAVFGLMYSGAMTALISCAREYSPAGATGLSIGAVMFLGYSGMALGAWQGGVFYDLCGNYLPSFSNASLSGLVNLLLLGLLYLYTVRWPRLRVVAG